MLNTYKISANSPTSPTNANKIFRGLWYWFQFLSLQKSSWSFRLKKSRYELFVIIWKIWCDRSIFVLLFIMSTRKKLAIRKTSFANNRKLLSCWFTNEKLIHWKNLLCWVIIISGYKLLLKIFNLSFDEHKNWSAL